MRIEPYMQVQQMYNAQKSNKVVNQAAPNFSDKLQISGMGKDIQTAKKAVAAAPDVREDVISSLRDKIQDGSYEVSGDAFADKLLEKYNQTLA